MTDKPSRTVRILHPFRANGFEILAVCVVSGLLVSLLVSEPRMAVNSGHHERVRDGLRQLSLAILAYQNRFPENAGLPVETAIAGSEARKDWPEQLISQDSESRLTGRGDGGRGGVFEIADDRLIIRSRWYDRAAQDWKHVTLIPVVVDAGIRDGAIRIDPHDEPPVPLIVMLPSTGVAGLPASMSPAVTPPEISSTASDSWKAVAEWVHVLYSTGEIRAVRPEELSGIQETPARRPSPTE